MLVLLACAGVMKTCIFSLAIGIILLLSRPTAGDTGALNTAVTLAGKLAEGALSGVQSKVSNYFYTAQQPEDPTVGSVLFINDDAVCSVHVTRESLALRCIMALP